MHKLAYKTSMYYSLPGMCGRSTGFSLGTTYACSTICKLIYSRLKGHGVPRAKNRVMSIHYYLSCFRNLLLDLHLHLFRGHAQTRWRYKNLKLLHRKDTACCKCHTINLINFLFSQHEQMFPNSTIGLTVKELNHSRIIKHFKRCTSRAFKEDQVSFSKQWLRSLTIQDLRSADSIPTLSLHSITLSLRKLAHEFAQHKEVPGDQLKPSKERIKNVTTRNQQCRCKSLLQN